jgi:hypothetical protein
MRFVFLLLLVISLQVSGQAPQAINYQGILRNASGQAIPNKQVKIRVSVSTNSIVDNSSVYTEEISAKTNEFGIYNVAIGKGKATKGTFASIAWGTNKYWVLIELDENLTNKFEFAGSMELASVPYALYAEKAKNVDNPVPGPAGPQGPQGLQGIKGDKGDKGDTGPAGAAGLTGPQGLQGIKGDIGATGATGAQGPIGLTGPAGPAGASGAQGPIGLTGPAGPAGATGADGAQGPIGLTGPTGATGPQGPIGLTGPAGPAGATGAQGPIGITGPAGPTGATGAQGPIGLTGPAGATGATGAQGPIGLTGPAGPAGASGPQGPIGLSGPAGPAGATGQQGPQGPTGLTGPAGATGQQGIDGKSVLNGITDPTSSTGNNGDFYINTTNNKIFGPKANGAWPAGVSLIGPQGTNSGSTSNFDWYLPDGLTNIIKTEITIVPDNRSQTYTVTPYTVPAGYNLYIRKINASPRNYGGQNTQGVYVNDVNLLPGISCSTTSHNSPFIVGENMVITFNAGDYWSGYGCSTVFAYIYGFLVPKSVTVICQNTAYVVPQGRTFIKYGSLNSAVYGSTPSLPEIFSAGETVAANTLGYIISN